MSTRKGKFRIPHQPDAGGEKSQLRGKFTEKLSSKRTTISQQKLSAKNDPAKPAQFGCAIDRVPDEVLLQFFSLLEASDLLVCARVCKRWLSLANDNLLWERLHRKYEKRRRRTNVAKKTTKSETEESSIGFWKQECLRSSIAYRDIRAFAQLKNQDAYTYLPAKMGESIKQAGIIFALVFVDGSGTSHFLRHRPDDVFFHRMSVTARWYGFDTVPPLTRLTQLKFVALKPVFYEANGTACQNSPCQRSLLYETTFDWSSWCTRNKPVASDSAVNSYAYKDGVLISTWKDGGGLAYIAANFHLNHLLQRCMQGTMKSIKSVPVHTHAIARADLSGLHRFRGTVELRNLRHSFWLQQFLHLDSTPSSVAAGKYCSQAIRSDRASEHAKMQKKIELFWKTDLFRNKTPDLCILDFTLVDDRERIVWSVSDFTKVSRNEDASINYDYEGQGYTIFHSDAFGEIKISLNEDGETGLLVVTHMDLLHR